MSKIRDVSKYNKLVKKETQILGFQADWSRVNDMGFQILPVLGRILTFTVHAAI